MKNLNKISTMLAATLALSTSTMDYSKKREGGGFSKPPLTKKQKQVRAKNKTARKARKITRRKR